MRSDRAFTAFTTTETLQQAQRRSQLWLPPSKYLWLLGSTVPGTALVSWIMVLASGLHQFWWLGSFLTFVAIPALDCLVGRSSDASTEQESESLDTDPFYRWATSLYPPAQYLSLLLACWLWAGGGWLSMSTSDKIALMVTVGIIGGVAINAAHELGHKRAIVERRLSKLALAQTCYGHFFVEHNRGHHVRVATMEDPASSRLGESVYQFILRSVTGGGAVRLEPGAPTARSTGPVALELAQRTAQWLADDRSPVCRVGCMVRTRCTSLARRPGGHWHLPARISELH